jgi:hypothetical protein
MRVCKVFVFVFVFVALYDSENTITYYHPQAKCPPYKRKMGDGKGDSVVIAH